MTKPTTEISHWEEYWEVSKLSASGAREFGEQIRSFQPLEPKPEPFAQAADEIQLPSPNDSLQRLFRKRMSVRSFSDSPLTTKEVGRVMSSLRQYDNRRVYASAGGLYPIHVFAMMLRPKIHGTAKHFAMNTARTRWG